jgi:hypothetical protein
MEKRGGIKFLIPPLLFEYPPDKNICLLCLYMTLSAHRWTGRFIGFLCLVMATLAGFMEGIFR